MPFADWIYQKGEPMKKPKIPRPAVRWRVTLYVLTIVIIIVTVIQLATEIMPEYIEYALYFISAAALASSVYYVIGDIGYIRNCVIKPAVNNNDFTRRLAADYRYRTLLTTVSSFSLNVIFALFNGIVGITEHSVWYGVMAAYYLMLCGMRGGSIWYVRASIKGKNSESDPAREISTYRHSGELLIIMGIALGAMVAVLLRGEGTKSYPGYTIYVIAAYTFWKVIMSAVNLARSRKTNSPLIITLRNINHADALVSLLSLETAMLVQFGSEESAGFSTTIMMITGICVCAGVLVIGVTMVAGAIIRKRKLSYENADDKFS